jgi:hypothetical protein
LPQYPDLEIKFLAEDLRMLKSSVAILAGVGLLSTVLIAQSSQPSGSQSSSKQPPATQLQPQAPQAGTESGPVKAKPSQQEPLRLRVIRVPRKEPKTLPIGILDRATPA